MHWLQALIFLILLVVTAFLAYKSYGRVYRNIMRGKKVNIDGDTSQRWRNMFRFALGQRKMFKLTIPAFLHLFIYVAFLITQVELVEVFVDGLMGQHRVFAQALGGFYTFVISFIEIMSVLAFFATLIFLIRRNLLKVPRLVMHEMKGWPRLDGNLILYFEIYLIICIFTMNGADVMLQKLLPAQYPSTGTLAISSFLGPALFGNLSVGTLQLLERIGWWGHILGVLGFVLYLPQSKHLHIMLAFPNTWFASLKPKGEMTNMPEVEREVALMFNPEAATASDAPPPAHFGAKDVEDLTRIQLLSAYSCTECGRCTASCPANTTGKKLSPRKVMMDVRDRMEEKATNEKQHGADFDDGKTLHSYISKEELNACTTCNACAEACPVNINPLSIILAMRRYKIMDEADSPAEWNLMFTNVENNGAVWQFSPQDRAKWRNEMLNESS
ncbi:MAG: (Fe-S)-binding protein [Chitinophagales bacterium]|nr:(Fe-S)-binding protein [Bacteroidota bacterium]